MSDDAPDERLAVQLAELRTDMLHFGRAVDKLNVDVEALTEALNQARGGWKAIAAVSALGGAAAGMIAALAKIKLLGP